MPDPLHILAFSQSFGRGGVERVLQRLLRGWSTERCRVTMVYGSDEQRSDDIPPGVGVVRVADSYFALGRALPGVVRRVAPDVIFCPGNRYAGVAAWLKLRLGVACPPIVAKISNRLDRDDQAFPVRQGYRAWLRAHPRFLDHIIAMTPAMAAETVAMTGIAADRVSVIPNPPNVPAGAAVPALDGDYLIGIGRLAPQKRWDRAIAAFARAARSDTKLLILGEGPERPALERQIAALGLAGRISLPGYATNPSLALAKARALVLTSDFEGAPGVLEEALALGTPVIATDSSVAVREIVRDPRLGDVLPIDDAEGLVAAVDRWLTPGAARPDPVPPRGADSIARYLALFDDIVRRAG